MSKVPQPLRLAWSLVQNRYLCFIVSCCVAFVSGSQYAVGAFAPSLKSKLGYTQIQINTVTTMTNIGVNFGFLPAFINDVFGARITCFLAGMLLFSGYFGLYAVSSGWIQVHYLIVGVFFFLIGNAGSASYVALLSTQMKNFSYKRRGVVVGMQTACIALSGAFFSFSYKLGFSPDVSTFLMFASVTGALPMVGWIFLAQLPVEENQTTKKEQPKGESNEKTALLQRKQETKEQPSETTPEEPAEPVEPVRTPLQRLWRILHKCEDDPTPYSTPIQVLTTIDYYLVSVMFFAGVGSGLVIINNIGSLVMSYGGDSSTGPLFVAVISISNCIARITFGAISDRFAHRLSRVGFLNIAVIGIGISSFILVYAPLPWGIYATVVLTGFSFGGIFSMIPSFLSERYGQRWFSINFILMNIPSAVASILLATTLSGYVYQQHIPARPDGTKGIHCYGRDCFRLTLYVDAALCLVAYSVGFILMHRTRPLYDKLLQQKLQAAAAAQKQVDDPITIVEEKTGLIANQGQVSEEETLAAIESAEYNVGEEEERETR